ncbi:MAG: CpaF family protein [Bacillota bacterium]|nr:CpaF family protein [Bacillota bacterium]
MSLLQKLERRIDQDKPQEEQSRNVVELQDPYAEWKRELHGMIVDKLKNLKPSEKQDEKTTIQKIGELVDQLVQEKGTESQQRMDRQRLKQEMVDEIIGFGPINPLLQDPDVTEIMVNGPRQIYAERGGKLQLTNVHFRDDDHVINVIERIVAPIGRRIDESSPMVDARLPDGSRVNAIIPPLALSGPTITIRKFAVEPFTVRDLVAFGTMTQEMADFLDACVRGRLNIFVSGGTGSGKTTTLNVLSSFIPETERIVTIEDAAEIQLRQPHVITLESRPSNIEGKGAVTIRDLVKNSLRMRPDRIVVGEVRSGEALDMLQAMNTGHDGSLTTGHANTPRDMIARLETMVLMAGMDLPIRAIREQIASAVDLIIHQSRLRDGSRRITHMTEVQGMEGDTITLQDIYRFKQSGIDERGKVVGEFVSTGIRPKFTEMLESNGIQLSHELFNPSPF